MEWQTERLRKHQNKSQGDGFVFGICLYKPETTPRSKIPAFWAVYLLIMPFYARHQTSYMHCLATNIHKRISDGLNLQSCVYTFFATKHYVRAFERSAPSVYPVTLSQSTFCLVTGNVRRNLLLLISKL